ncbi:STE20-related kinase adapter protein alpha isoform X2 [Thrips palmi]|uniref:STE20-related kinase adapter protein alpha isoform X2 n=1 Tax=Thrips palmi TaxID=161013 RepID=A0A6P8YZP7_THRPL|nr:STE20-related kinase adapter protein alpha isoform X2 [Thrips palmi]
MVSLPENMTPPLSCDNLGGVFGPDPTQYAMTSVLGQCCDDAGQVYLAVYLPTNTPIALKKFNMDKAKDEMDNIQNEIILTRQLRHPNVVVINAAFVLDNYICVVSPLMAFGSCRDLLNRHFTEGLPELAIAFILKDVLLALDYIHKKGYIHRAVRASHILINEYGQAVLSGLRYACRLVKNGRWQRNVHSFPSSTSRNLNWLSPELLEQNMQGYNEKSDMYSLGVTACELANGMAPFQDHPPTLMLTEKVRGFAPVLLDFTTCPQYSDTGQQNSNPNQAHDSGVGDSVGSNGNSLEGGGLASRRFTDHFHRFSELCLQRDPEHRPSAAQLLLHSFFKLPKRMNAPPLPQLLHPVIPLTKVVLGTESSEDFFGVADRLSDLDLNTCEWDF